jgi:hypothetical protein
MHLLLAALLATNPPCAEHASALDALSNATLSATDLRGRAIASIQAARSDIASAPGGGAIPVDPVLQGFVRRIREIDDMSLRTEVADIALSLREVCRRASAPSGVASAASVDRARLTEILARPEFDLRDEPVGLFDRIWRWLRRIVLSLLEARGTATYGEAGRYVILGLGVLAAAFVARGALRARSRGGVTAPRPAAGDARAHDSPQAHLGRAETALRRGDCRLALREQMLAVLATLERHQLAARGRSRTNREVAEEARGRGASAELATRLGELAARYDQTWYGLRAVSAADVGDFAARAGTVRAGVEGAA